MNGTTAVLMAAGLLKDPQEIVTKMRKTEIEEKKEQSSVSQQSKVDLRKIFTQQPVHQLSHGRPKPVHRKSNYQSRGYHNPSGHKMFSAKPEGSHHEQGHHKKEHHKEQKTFGRGHG